MIAQHRWHTPDLRLGRFWTASSTLQVTVAGSVGYLIAYAASGLFGSNSHFSLSFLPSGWETTTSTLLAPFLGFVAAAATFFRRRHTKLDRVDAFWLRSATVFVVTVSVITSLLLDIVAGLTPMLMGSGALVVMRAALVERWRKRRLHVLKGGTRVGSTRNGPGDSVVLQSNTRADTTRTTDEESYPILTSGRGKRPAGGDAG